MAGRKSKYSSENSNANGLKNWSVAEYIRLSQEDGDNGEDKQESNSITSQKALLNEFIEEHDDLIVYDCYVDDGYTGTDFNRPGFQRLLEDMRKGNFTDEDLENAKNLIYATIYNIEEEQDTEISYYFGQEISNLDSSIEEYKNKIEKVTREDVIEIANNTQYNTIYFLRN